MEIERLENLLPESFARLAEVYLTGGEHQKAIDIIEKHIDKFPEYPGGYWMLGRIYFELKQKEKALTNLYKVLQILPEHAGALDLIGKIHMESGEQAIARSYFNQVNRTDVEIDFEPDEFDQSESPGRISKPVTSVKTGESASGRFATETMVKLYIKQGHMKLARKMCEQILTNEPENNRVKQLMDELEK